MRDAPLSDLVRRAVLDAELAALVSPLLEARTPVVVAGRDTAATDALVDALRAALPDGSHARDVARDDDFDWLPEAVELGWRRERAQGGRGHERISSSSGVLIARGLASPQGIEGGRARIVVRALALGYGLLASMQGDGLESVFARLRAPDVGTDEDERSRLGVVLALTTGEAGARVTAAHYVRPVVRDQHGHVQRPPPAVLATWNPATDRFDHFAWGVLPELAARLGLRPVELEREQARRAGLLASLAGAEARG